MNPLMNALERMTDTRSLKGSQSTLAIPDIIDSLGKDRALDIVNGDPMTLPSSILVSETMESLISELTALEALAGMLEAKQQAATEHKQASVAEQLTTPRHGKGMH